MEVWHTATDVGLNTRDAIIVFKHLLVFFTIVRVVKVI